MSRDEGPDVSDYRLGKKVVKPEAPKPPVIKEVAPGVYSTNGGPWKTWIPENEAANIPLDPFWHLREMLKKQEEAIEAAKPDSVGDVMAGGLILHDAEFPLLEWGTW